MSGRTIRKTMYQPGVIVEFLGSLIFFPLIQSAHFMAMLAICDPFTFYRNQQERLEAELTIPQHSLGRSAIYYDCLHYPGGNGRFRMGHLGQMPPPPPPPPPKKLHTRSRYSNKAVTMFMRQCSLPMKL